MPSKISRAPRPLPVGRRIAPSRASSTAAKQDVTVRLLATFKRLISEGALVAGSRLPAERELAETFQVSRSSLRQALKVLESMGIITQRVGQGTFLNSAVPSVLGQPMEFLILLQGISFEELMEARIIVEPELAARAAVRATEHHLVSMRNAMVGMKDHAVDLALLIEYDLQFHQVVFDAAGNRVCSMMFSVIHRSLHNLLELTSRMVPVEHTLHLHQRIYSAIRKRDPDEARKRMAEHLQDAKELLARADDRERSSHLQNRIVELAAQPGRLVGRRKP